MYSKESKTKNILKYLAIGGGIIVCSILAPKLPQQMIGAYIKKKEFDRHKWLQDLKRLQRRDLVSLDYLPNGEIEIKLLDNGRKSVLKYDFDSMKLVKPKKWDGIWRLVMFDIPSAQNKSRDAVRLKLRDLGFYQLQKSVFIHPFPCEKEIDFIGSLFNVRNNIILMEIKSFDGSEKLENRFNVRK